MRLEVGKRLAQAVVRNQIHHTAAKLPMIHTTPDCGRTCSTAAEKISMAAT